MPIGPMTLVVHIASVWVPFTSESKEAIAHYPEIIKEIKLALQEIGRKLASYVSKKRRIQFEGKKRDYIEMFIPHVGEALKELIRGRTTFIIAQRLSTVRNADVILVLENGNIVERGSHQELLSRGGIYQKIYELQLRPQEAASDTLSRPTLFTAQQEPVPPEG